MANKEKFEKLSKEIVDLYRKIADRSERIFDTIIDGKIVHKAHGNISQELNELRDMRQELEQKEKLLNKIIREMGFKTNGVIIQL